MILGCSKWFHGLPWCIGDVLQPSDHVWQGPLLILACSYKSEHMRMRRDGHGGGDVVAQLVEHLLSTQRAWVQVPTVHGMHFLAFFAQKGAKKSRGAPPRTPGAHPPLNARAVGRGGPSPRRGCYIAAPVRPVASSNDRTLPESRMSSSRAYYISTPCSHYK